MDKNWGVFARRIKGFDVIQAIRNNGIAKEEYEEPGYDK